MKPSIKIAILGLSVAFAGAILFDLNKGFFASSLVLTSAGLLAFGLSLLGEDFFD